MFLFDRTTFCYHFLSIQLLELVSTSQLTKRSRPIQQGMQCFNDPNESSERKGSVHAVILE